MLMARTRRVLLLAACCAWSCAALQLPASPCALRRLVSPAGLGFAPGPVAGAAAMGTGGRRASGGASAAKMAVPLAPSPSCPAAVRVSARVHTCVRDPACHGRLGWGPGNGGRRAERASSVRPQGFGAGASNDKKGKGAKGGGKKKSAPITSFPPSMLKRYS